MVIILCYWQSSIQGSLEAASEPEVEQGPSITEEAGAHLSPSRGLRRRSVCVQLLFLSFFLYFCLVLVGSYRYPVSLFTFLLVINRMAWLFMYAVLTKLKTEHKRLQRVTVLHQLNWMLLHKRTLKSIGSSPKIMFSSA